MITLIKAVVIGKFAFSNPLNRDVNINKIIDLIINAGVENIYYNMELSHVEPSMPIFIGGNIEIDMNKKVLSSNLFD